MGASLMHTSVGEHRDGRPSPGPPLVVLALAMSAAACGSSSPSAPSPSPSPSTGALQAPTGFGVFSQRVALTSNEIVLDWYGTAPGYRVLIGSTSNASDVRSVDLTSTRYTFLAARTANTYYARVVATDGDQTSAPTSELTVSTLDLRHIIDALFFNGGPMSEFRAVQPGWAPAAVWPDGTHLRMPVSREAGESIRTLMQAAIEEYSSVVGGAITGTTELVDDDLRSVAPSQLPPFTIATRISTTQCPAIAAGCASIGPAPLGSNASVVTLASTSVTGTTIGHELGHANGLFHLLRINSNRPEFRFLMSSPSSTSTLSDVEKAAIAAARDGGIRAGTTREQALAADLVPANNPQSRSLPAQKSAVGAPDLASATYPESNVHAYGSTELGPDRVGRW